MTETYRQRATKAEQKNQLLINELSKRPNYEWFVNKVRLNLKQAENISPQMLAFQVKQLKQYRGSLIDEHISVANALESLLWPNMAIGNKAIIQAAINLLKGYNIEGSER